MKLQTFALALSGALALTVMADSADAKTLYVNRATGSDATTYAANSATSPWASIGRAAWGSTNRSAPNANEAARAGDTVIVVAGTYNQAASGQSRSDPLYNPVNSGVAGSPLTFRAEGRVTLQSTTYQGPVIGSNDRDHVVWDGFFIDETNVATVPDTGPVVIWGSNYSTVRNCEIDGKMASWADNHVGIRVEQSNFSLVQGNLIYGVASNGTTGQNDAGVMLYDSNDTVIEHNEIYAVGTGVYIKGIHAPMTQLRTVVRYNLLHSMPMGRGVALNTTEGAKVYQNVIRDTHIGISIIDLVHNGTPRNDTIQNNTLHNITQAAIQFRGSAAGWQNTRFFNNIISGSGNYVAWSEAFTSPANSFWEHNVYHGYRGFASFVGASHTFATWQSVLNKDRAAPASQNADPRMVDPAARDYRLCTGAGQPSSRCTAASPALTLGVDILDLNGNGSTTDPIRAGAYITGNETIGRGGASSGGGGTTPPVQPTGVRIVTPGN